MSARNAARKELDRFSFTAMSLADSCLLAYAARYGNGDRFAPIAAAPASEALERGRVLHAIIRLYLDYLDEFQLDTAREMLPTFIERAYVEDTETLSTATWDDVWIGAMTFGAWYRHDPAKSLGGEYRLERVLSIPGQRDALIIGYPDAGDLAHDERGELVLFTDWKTGWDAAVSDLNRFQGETICWIAGNPEGPFANRRSGYRVGWPRQKQYSQTYVIEPRDVLRHELRMRTIITRIRAARKDNAFPARPGQQCSYCTLASSCAANLDLRALGVQIGTLAEAQTALGEIVLLEGARTQRLGALCRFVDTYGAVRAAGVIAYFKRAERERIKNVTALLQRAGFLPKKLPDPIPDAVRFWIDLLAVNGRKLTTKKIQNDPRLDGLWEAEYSTSFEHEIEKSAPPDDADDELVPPPPAGASDAADR